MAKIESYNEFWSLQGRFICDRSRIINLEVFRREPMEGYINIADRILGKRVLNKKLNNSKITEPEIKKILEYVDKQEFKRVEFTPVMYYGGPSGYNYFILQDDMNFYTLFEKSISGIGELLNWNFELFVGGEKPILVLMPWNYRGENWTDQFIMITTLRKITDPEALPKPGEFALTLKHLLNVIPVPVEKNEDS